VKENTAQMKTRRNMWTDNNRTVKDNFTNGKNVTTIYFKTKTR